MATSLFSGGQATAPTPQATAEASNPYGFAFDDDE